MTRPFELHVAPLGPFALRSAELFGMLPSCGDVATQIDLMEALVGGAGPRVEELGLGAVRCT